MVTHYYLVCDNMAWIVVNNEVVPPNIVAIDCANCGKQLVSDIDLSLLHTLPQDYAYDMIRFFTEMHKEYSKCKVEEFTVTVSSVRIR